MASLLRDIRYGLRQLLRNPGFTGVMVLTLALGIGANTAIFSVVYAVLWRPMPYAAPDRMVHLFETHPDDSPDQYRLVSRPDFEDWRQQSQSFEDMVRLQPLDGPFYFVLSGRGQPREVLCYPMTSELFRFLGVPPLKGRYLSPEDEQPGRNRVVVVSHYFWQQRMGGDPNAVGSEIELSRQTYTVIGVMPAEFEFPPFQRSMVERRELWAPSVTNPATVGDRAWRAENVYARLKPGTTSEQAEAELRAISARLGELYPETNKGWGAKVIQMHGRFLGSSREKPVLFLLLAAVGIVLLIGCANIASLLTARAAARQKEIAIRGALGAGRGSIARQLLTESLLLALLGGVVGLAGAAWSLRILGTLIPPTVPRADQITIDGSVLAFTLGITVLTGLIFGALPALSATRRSLFQTLKLGGSEAGSHRPSAAGSPLIILEVALSLVLLIGAGLMLKGLARLLGDNFGLRPERVLTVRTLLPPERYGRPNQARQFQEDLLGRVSNLPGVEVAGLVSTLPLHSSLYVTKVSVMRAGQEDVPRQDLARSNFKIISPGYFEAMGVPLLAGRDVSLQDTEASPAVVVVCNALARSYWPNESPLGKRLKMVWRGGYEGPWRTVVGVAGDVKLHLEEQYEPLLYIPHRQLPYPADAEYTSYFTNMRWSNLVTRTAADPMSIAAAVRAQLLELDPDQPAEILSMSEVIGATMEPKEFSTSLTAIFALIATLLAAAGIYSVIAYTVSLRTREIGLRMAMGAQQSDVMKMVLKKGLKVTLIGVTIGLLASVGLTRLVRSQLYQVSPTDPVVYLGVSLLLIAVSLLACYVPARRASRVDPMTALRHE
jgi:putative ABC transport system permease protein